MPGKLKKPRLVLHDAGFFMKTDNQKSRARKEASDDLSPENLSMFLRPMAQVKHHVPDLPIFLSVVTVVSSW